MGNWLLFLAHHQGESRPSAAKEWAKGSGPVSVTALIQHPSLQPGAQLLLTEPLLKSAAKPPAPAHLDTTDHLSRRQRRWRRLKGSNGERCPHRNLSPQEQTNTACRQVADIAFRADTSWLSVEVAPVKAHQAMPVTLVPQIGSAFLRRIPLGT